MSQDPRQHIQVELDNGILREHTPPQGHMLHSELGALHSVQNSGTAVSLFLDFLVPLPLSHSWPLLRRTRGALPLAVLMCFHLPKPSPVSMYNFRRFKFC